MSKDLKDSFNTKYYRMVSAAYPTLVSELNLVFAKLQEMSFRVDRVDYNDFMVSAIAGHVLKQELSRKYETERTTSYSTEFKTPSFLIEVFDADKKNEVLVRLYPHPEGAGGAELIGLIGFTLNNAKVSVTEVKGHMFYNELGLPSISVNSSIAVESLLEDLGLQDVPRIEDSPGDYIVLAGVSILRIMPSSDGSRTVIHMFPKTQILRLLYDKNLSNYEPPVNMY